MNDGIIASRYARALLKYVLETGGGDRVCDQVARLAQALHQVPRIRMLLDNPEGVSTEQKLALLRAALGDEPVADELDRFLRLVLGKGRVPLLQLMCHDFVDMYHTARNQLYARLTTAVPAPEALVARLRDLVARQTGKEVVIETFTDPALIGGFVFDVGDNRMDASVLHSLRQIRREFQETNRRIV